MQEHRHLPDSNRLSVLTAVILLAYALTRLIALPPFGIQASLLGVEMAFQISSSAVVAFLVAGLTATGMDWLLRSHPHLEKKNTLEHWILPALTAWIIGISIFSLSESTLWWLAFLVGGIFLVLICVAEYVAVDPDDLRYGVAVASLTGLSFVLLLVLITALRAVGMRLVVFLPPLFLAVWLVSMRTLHLRLGGRWEFYLVPGHCIRCGAAGCPSALLADLPASIWIAAFGSGLCADQPGRQLERGAAFSPRHDRTADCPGHCVEPVLDWVRE